MTAWIPTVADTNQWVAELHAGQLYGGQPYIEHVREVAREVAIYGTWAVLAGLLHDVIEDTFITLDNLRERGYPQIVVEAVEAVSLRPGEDYLDMIRRATQHELGCLIKWADNQCNRRNLPSLARTDPVRAERLQREKYGPAAEILEPAIHGWFKLKRFPYGAPLSEVIL